MNTLEIKKILGKKAAERIQEGMIVGLGTGSTAECFIQSLIEKIHKERYKKIIAVASSEHSEKLAREGGIQMMNLNEVPRIDITIDGADEINTKKQMIKGAGGAMLREKILAMASQDMMIIADESKLVDVLGKTKLPVEIIHYGALMTQRHIEALGYKGVWRKKSFQASTPTIRLPNREEDLFITDQGNIILDLFFSSPLHNPQKVHDELIQIPGVIETGFFFRQKTDILIGYADGRIEEKPF